MEVSLGAVGRELTQGVDAAGDGDAAPREVDGGLVAGDGGDGGEVYRVEVRREEITQGSKISGGWRCSKGEGIFV